MKINGTNMSMIRGDTETITVSCQDTDGNAIDLVVGDTIYFTIKNNVNTEIKILQKTIINFVNGAAIIEIAHNDTKLLKCMDYVYDVQLTRGDGTVTTIIPPSRFKIEGEVTYE